MANLVEGAAKQRTRLARESMYGVLPAAPNWKELNDIKIVPKPEFDSDPFAPGGSVVPSLVVINDDSASADVSGRASYNGLFFILCSMLGMPTSALVAGNTYDHTWLWDGRADIDPVTYVVDYGSGKRARRFLGGFFNNLSLGISRGGLDFGSAMLGKDVQLIPALGGMTNTLQTLTITGDPTSGDVTVTYGGYTATIPFDATAVDAQALLEAMSSIGSGNVAVTGGPLPGAALDITLIGKFAGKSIAAFTVDDTGLTGGTGPAATIVVTTPGADTGVMVPAVPIFATQFDIWSDDSWAALGTTQLLALYSLGLDFDDRYARTAPVNSAKTSDGLVENDGQNHTASLRLGADAAGEAFLNTIRAGAQKFVRAKAVGALTGDASNHYQFQVDECIILTDTDGYDSENGVHVMTWNAVLASDAVSGNCLQVTLRNTINPATF